MASASTGGDGVDPLAHVPAPEVAEPLVERAALHTANRVLLTAGVMGATVMQILDQTIANVAVPHMRAELGATADTITWVLTSYIVASAVAIPATGWFADRIGSRNLFLGAVAGFVVASMLCGIATSLPEMVVFRILQGVAAAFINPLSQTVMLDINKPSRQAGAMAIWGMSIMVGPILGPVIGGWLTENYNWRWVFYINVPLGVVCMAILWALLPSRPIMKRQFDGLGFTLLALAIASFQIMLDRGQSNDWFQSWEIRIEALVAVAAAWMFITHMLTAKQPMFDRALFRNPNLVTGMAFMLIIGTVMLATTALMPPMLQGLFGYPVLDTGLLLTPRGLGVVCSMSVTGKLVQRGVDPRAMIAIGLSIVAFSLYQMTTWTLVMGSTPIILSGVIQGLGMGLAFMPLNLTAFATLPPRYRTEGASLMNLCRNIGASAGISSVTSLLARNIQVNHMELGGHITGYSISAIDPGIASIFGRAGETITAMLDLEVNRQAAMIAYLDDFKVMMVTTMFAVPLALLLRRSKSPASRDEVHVAFD